MHISGEMEAELAGFVSTAEAARMLGVSRQRVQILASRGELLGTMTPLGRLFAAGYIEDVASQRKGRGGADERVAE